MKTLILLGFFDVSIEFTPYSLLWKIEIVGIVKVWEMMRPPKVRLFSVAVHMAATLFLYSQESKPVLHWT